MRHQLIPYTGYSACGLTFEDLTSRGHSICHGNELFDGPLFDVPTCLWCAAERSYLLIPWTVDVSAGVSVINPNALSKIKLP